MELRRVEGDVFHIRLTDRLNVLTVAFIRRFNELLDEVGALDWPAALFLSADNPNVFCAGLDLKVIMGNAEGVDRAEYTNSFLRLIRRLIAFPCPTVVLTEGKVIAGGVFVVLGFDYRVAVDSGKTYFISTSST